MKYILFGGECYYAKGGWNDYLGHGKELDPLIDSECLKNFAIDWWHIVDTETKEIVAGSKHQAHNSDLDGPDDMIKQKYTYDSHENKWVKEEK